jgi:Spy/CpxP family protein refolding chaperone
LLREQQVDFRLALIELLTPEQRSLYNELSEAAPRSGQGRSGAVRPMNELWRGQPREG